MPSTTGLRSNPPARVSANRQPSRTEALTQPAPPIITASLAVEGSAAGVAGASLGPGGVTLSASASAQAVVQLTLNCPAEPARTLGTLLATVGVSPDEEGGAALIGRAQGAAAGLASGASSVSSANITQWLDQILAALTQTFAPLGDVARMWATRYADLISSWAARIADLVHFWVPRSLHLGNFWLQEAEVHLAETRGAGGGLAFLQEGASWARNAPLVLGDPPPVPGDSPFAGFPARLPDRLGCVLSALPGGLLDELSPSGPGFGEIPGGSELPLGAGLRLGESQSGEMGSRGGGGGGGSGPDHHSASHVMYVRPPDFVPEEPGPGAVIPTTVLVSPAPSGGGARPSKLHSRSEDDPETDDPDMGDPDTGNDDMDDPGSDDVTPDEPSGRVKTSSSRPVTAGPPPPESDEPGGWLETHGAVLAGIASGVASPEASSSTAVDTNVTVLVGIITPAVLPDSDVDLPGGPALPAALPGRRADTPADQDRLPITDQLAGVQLAWPVRRPPFELTAAGAPRPLPISGELADVRPSWPVQYPLLEVIVLGAVRSFGQWPEKGGASRNRRNGMVDGIPQRT